MTPENADYYDLHRYFREEGFDRVMIGASQGRAHKKDPWDLRPDPEGDHSDNADRAMDEFLDYLKGGPTPAVAKDLRSALRRISQSLDYPSCQARIRCGAGRNMLAITADGKLYPCHRYAGDVGFEIGSISEGRDQERLAQYYKEILGCYDRHCSHCWARVICGGQCAWYLSKPDGHIGTPDKEGCDALRRSFERQLWFYNAVRELTESEEAKRDRTEAPQ